MAGIPAFSSVMGVTECGVLASLEPIKMLKIAKVKRHRSMEPVFPPVRWPVEVPGFQPDVDQRDAEEGFNVISLLGSSKSSNMFINNKRYCCSQSMTQLDGHYTS